MERIQPVYREPLQTDYNAAFTEIVGNLEDISIEQAAEDLRTATPESQSNPQLTRPESEADGTVSKETHNKQLNYRLSNLGFILDATRSYLTNEQEVDAWLELKHAVAQAKTISDTADKVWTIIPLESAVYDFISKFDVTEADCIAAMSL